MRVLIGPLSALAACLGIGCGVDLHGTGPSPRPDAGALDDGAVSTGSVTGSDGGGAGNGDGGAAGTVGTDSGSAGTVGMESGATTSSSGTDAATTDAVAVVVADASSNCSVSGSMCPQGQQCDPTLGCVACTADVQCPASTRFCLAGSCVECKTNTDCGNSATPSCFPGDHTCHTACTSNQQCPQDGNARICNLITGACVGCSTPADCPTSQAVCDPTAQQCVQCASSADCAGTSTPACLSNRCVLCASNADCSGGAPYCITGGDSAGRCVQCLQSAQCPANAPSCNGGTCGKRGG